MQDAVLVAGDLSYLAKAHKFALIANRFAWEEDEGGSHFQRRRSGLHFERVNAVKSHGIDRAQPDQVLSLLSITFEPAAEPSGRIVLSFSGGAEIALEVECIEARLSDLGPHWEAIRKPHHEG
jgi:hypothetical protein